MSGTKKEAAKYNEKIINILNEDETEWLYVPNVVYHKYGNLERHLQMIIPFRRQWEDDKSSHLFCLFLVRPGTNRRCITMFLIMPN